MAQPLETLLVLSQGVSWPVAWLFETAEPQHSDVHRFNMPDLAKHHEQQLNALHL